MGTSLSASSAAIARADADGWRGYLTTDEDEPAELAMYCPACAAVEFGD